MSEDLNSGDFNKPEESDESGTWPYSYPSYTRFTFTGKPKSRLGRNNRQNRSTAITNLNTKEGTSLHTGDNCSGDTSSKSSSDALKTSGINWLKGDTGSLTNPFTPGKNIFLFSKSDQDSQINNTDSGIDTYSSSQSNFFTSLKTDSAQSFNNKYNLTFNKTPFRGEEKNDNNLLKEHNTAKTSFPKFEIPHVTKEENKENIGKKQNRFQGQENSFDPSWNQLKRICDAAILCPPVSNTENSNFPSFINRDKGGRLENESYKSNIFAPISVNDQNNDKTKDDDDSINIPLDLSSGTSHKTLFNRSITGSDQSAGTVVPQIAVQEIHYNNVEDEFVNNRNSSETISSILPTFLVPIKKNKCKTAEAGGSNNKFFTVDESDVKPEFVTKSVLSFDELPNPFTIQPKTNNFQSSSSNFVDNSDKQEVPMNDIHYEYQNILKPKSSCQDIILNDIVSSTFTTKMISPPNAEKQSKDIVSSNFSSELISPPNAEKQSKDIVSSAFSTKLISPRNTEKQSNDIVSSNFSTELISPPNAEKQSTDIVSSTFSTKLISPPNAEKQSTDIVSSAFPTKLISPRNTEKQSKDIVSSNFSTKLISPPNQSKDTVLSTFSNKIFLPPNAANSVASENKLGVNFSNLDLSSKEIQNIGKIQSDHLSNNNPTKLESPKVSENYRKMESNIDIGTLKQCPPVIIDQNMLKTECTKVNSQCKSSTTISQINEGMVSDEKSYLNNRLENPITNEAKAMHMPLNVAESSLNAFGNTIKPIQSLPNQSESNSLAPLYSQQSFQNIPQKFEENENNFQSQSQVTQVKRIENSEAQKKQLPIEHCEPYQKQPLHNRDPVVLNQRQEPRQLSTYSHQQRTYLAPHQANHKMPRADFPHVKPDAPQQMSSRQSFVMMEKPHDSYKMPPPRGRLSRSNGELFVNGKAYTILSILGRGGSSEVYQVLDPKSSKLLAVKCVDLSMVDRTIADGYLNEIDLLEKLQGCSSVIKMFDYEYIQEYKMLYVVMEKGDTDLSHLIRDISKTKKISMSMIIYYWTEMLTAVRDIHEQGIIHSDLKPANFLLVSGRLKLIDFGIASSQGDMTSVVKEVTTGTWNYMSPEAIRNNSTSGKGFKITYKSDVWSLGCILYNLVYGKTPFSHITNTWGKLQAIADSSHQIDFPEVGAPVILLQALRSCFHRDPKQRPTVAELLNLPYHASTDANLIGRQLLTILPQEWWHKVAHLFPEIKCQDNSKVIEIKDSGGNAV